MTQSKIPKKTIIRINSKKKYHLIREIVQRNDVTIEKMFFTEHLANPFIKTLPNKVFDEHKDNIGV